MKIFWLRISLFSFLWAFNILTESVRIPISIIIFAIAFGIYFLLTIPKALLWKYSGLLLLTGIHGLFFVEEISLTVLLLLYIVIDASFRLTKKKLIILLIEVVFLFLLLSYLRDLLTIENMVFYAFIAFLAFALNQSLNERREQYEIYEQLLGEYRTLKRLHLAAEDHARLEERTRIARDIHDSVGHRLTALIMRLEVLSIQEQSNAYDELKQIAKDSLEDTRLAVKTLKAKESEGITTVVHLIRKLESESHLLVQFTIKQGVLSIPVTNKMSVVLYRVIQEALTNIMRHGETRDAHITLGKSAIGDIYFEISNPLRDPKPFVIGFGLKNMRERVEEMNGQLSISQSEDQFIISGIIPKEEG
ncbi:sensor histidine kinase [Oceanobacillus longus]|uniref:histidine kinase n=1 Tax=Oceanobacillus longus TaxID=930120 RepID=A0ABV8GXW4_9BACI